MTNNRDRFFDYLTFSQRYGYESLPEPMRLETISSDLRREVWNIVRELLLEKRTIGNNNPANPYFRFGEQDKRFIERVLGRLTRQPEDQVVTNYYYVEPYFRTLILEDEFNTVLDFVQIVINDRGISQVFTKRIKDSFEQHGSAYQLDTSRHPYQFFPRVSKEQGDATQQAIQTLRKSGMDGAATHLRQAAEHTNTRQYADSIVDSVHAVESVARVIAPKASKTLGPALKSLEDAGVLKHAALKEAFQRLYGYTNDEQGLRHALLDRGTPEVGLDEAMFMFGACASFAAYLVSKHRQLHVPEGVDS